MRSVIKYVVTFIIMVVMLLGALVLSATIPSEYMKENITKSAITLYGEGAPKNQYIVLEDKEMGFDNQSDALMLNIAYSIDYTTPLYAALTAKKNYVPGSDQVVYQDSNEELKSAAKFKIHNEPAELMDLAQGAVNESFEYARYWHGYLSILRPLLCFFDLDQLRVIFTIVLNILILALTSIIWKKKNAATAIILLLGFVCSEIIYMGISIQGIWMYLIAIISSIMIALNADKIKDIKYIFLIIGIIANFFDLLTVPLLSLGIPLTIYLVVNKKENNLKQNLQLIFSTSIFWLIGYSAMWFSKWIMFDLIYDRNLIITALNQVLYRTSGVVDIPAKYVMLYNFKLIKSDVLLIAAALATILVVTLICNRKNLVITKKQLINIIPYLIIAIMPIVWYVVLKDHSLRHAFFTYRNLFLTMINITFAVLALLDTTKNIGEHKNGN